MRGKIRLCDDTRSNTTGVSNIFIDNYMTRTPGEYVKVYLYLLRSMSAPGRSFSISSMADAFGCRAEEVRDALEYWEKLNLMQLSFDADGSLREICISTNPPTAAPETAAFIVSDGAKEDLAEPSDTHARRLPPMKPQNADNMRRICESDAFSQLIFIIERYLGRPLSRNDMEYIIYWNTALGMSEDLIVYLVETQVERSLTSITAINNIACEWYESGILTARDASRHMSDAKSPNVSDRVIDAIVTAFGITGRSLGSLEREYAAKWSLKWGFSETMISKACERSLAKTGRSNFEYANRILENWHTQNIADMDALRVSDEEHKKAQSKKYRSIQKKSISAASDPSKKNAHLSGAGYDFDDISRKLALR